MARPPITKARPYTPQSGAFKGRTFHTEREYRNELAKLKGFTSWHEQQRVTKMVTPKSFGELRTSQKQARARALDALSKVRHGETLTRAAKQAGTTPTRSPSMPVRICTASVAARSPAGPTASFAS